MDMIADGECIEISSNESSIIDQQTQNICVNNCILEDLMSFPLPDDERKEIKILETKYAGNYIFFVTAI
jgi:hypothetical protein